ncbi:transposase [Aquirufa ecclesiirivi]|uniref:REP-associated tyrosine transposase n=1 Tax=Aquirufa ecclesiirivi TaxID=2715124 RepID=UPI0022A8911D|nr:transposase [Aquirufa ecclesiirivi]MCZ2471903.1 transposase [Aquirufa ecclesiirivi]
MAHAYSIQDPQGQYFITCTVHQWVDIFTRKLYVDILLESLRYCQQKKGLKIHAWVVMSNHIHLIVSSESENLSNIIRDFKKFTSKQIFKAIKSNPEESRKNWLLWLFTKDDQICFWQSGYHGKQILTQSFFENKLDYIHLNPVRAGFIEKEEEYMYSSCSDYYGTRKGLLELELT